MTVASTFCAQYMDLNFKSGLIESSFKPLN